MNNFSPVTKPESTGRKTLRDMDELWAIKKNLYGTIEGKCSQPVKQSFFLLYKKTKFINNLRISRDIFTPF